MDELTQKRPKPNLSNNCDVHWRTDNDGYEYLMRTMAGLKGVKNWTDAERQKWLTAGWRKRLEAMRKKHRAAGIADQKFWHPSRKA